MTALQATISDAYRLEQQQLHRNPRYGVASQTFAPLVSSLLRVGGCRTLSDYGAGKCNLKFALGLRDDGPIGYYPYDPAFPDYGPPRPAELVTCIDVLEHVEPESLNTVLAELSSLARRLVLLTIHTGPAKKVLSDGRNAHLIQQPQTWWLERLRQHFDIVHAQAVPKGFFVVATPPGGLQTLQYGVDLAELRAAASRARPRKRFRPLRSLRGLLRL